MTSVLSLDVFIVCTVDAFRLSSKASSGQRERRNASTVHTINTSKLSTLVIVSNQMLCFNLFPQYMVMPLNAIR